jgi:hypothetical protein
LVIASIVAEQRSEIYTGLFAFLQAARLTISSKV